MRIDRVTLRQIAAAVAIAMLVASIPAVGVAVIPDRSGGPCISLNICHPLQSLSGASATVSIARPAPPRPLTHPLSSAPAAAAERVRIAGFTAAPDPPPPKRLA